MAGIKKTYKTLIIFFIIAIIGNGIALPLALFIGAMGTDSPGKEFHGFKLGFSMVQAIPLVLLLVTIFMVFQFIYKTKKTNFIRVFFIFLIVLNIIVLPLSFFVGSNAKDISEGGVLAYFDGFFFIQAIPLIVLIIGGCFLWRSSKWMQ